MEVPAALSYRLGAEAEWAHSFPHWDSTLALIRHVCDWRPEFSACQLIWSHRYGSNLIWGERAGFCQRRWDKAAAFTNPLNKLSREGPVSWQWSSSALAPHTHTHTHTPPGFNKSLYLTFTSPCQKGKGREGKEYTANFEEKKVKHVCNVIFYQSSHSTNFYKVLKFGFDLLKSRF